MLTKPVALAAPVGAMSLDERPELPRVVRDAQVTELVHNHVVQDNVWREHEPPIEGERAARRARAPESALPADSDSAVHDTDALRLLASQAGHDPSRRLPGFRLTNR